MNDKIFTFQDWLQGTLPKPSEDPNIFRRTEDYGGVGHIRSLVYNRKMLQEEADKIYLAKSKTFHKSVEINSERLFQIHKSRAERSRDSEQYIHSLVEEVEQAIDEKTLRKINAGDVNVSGIFAEDFKRLIKSDEKEWKIPARLLNSELRWDDREALIFFNKFQMHSYMNHVSERLKQAFDHYRINENISLDTQAEKKELSKIEKVQLIENVYKREGVNNYEDAIKIATEEAGQHLYANYNSFKTARKDVMKYL